jgi:hypothetical protein
MVPIPVNDESSLRGHFSLTIKWKMTILEVFHLIKYFVLISYNNTLKENRKREEKIIKNVEEEKHLPEE